MANHYINRGPAPIGSVRYTPGLGWHRKVGPSAEDKRLIQPAKANA